MPLIRYIGIELDSLRLTFILEILLFPDFIARAALTMLLCIHFQSPLHLHKSDQHEKQTSEQNYFIEIFIVFESLNRGRFISGV